ncbi:unnamed protein product [Schistocephalus solidus]|uniref:Reverse transcriptase domain-containing protein n=1 Tax=Schistocephalus solidus TaxID=70667 RepID=A0A183TPM1_SCHSO|nr:unnamed protein product [Schistocephalus solidus]
MQRSMDLFAAACDNFELRINTEKTVVMHQPSPSTLYTAAHINVNGTQLKSVDTFTYVVISHAARNSTMRSPIGSLKPAKPLDAFKMWSGIDMVSTSAPNSRCTMLPYCLCCCMERRRG